MNTDNKNDVENKSGSYREEDQEILEIVDNLDRKLRFFKILTPIIGALLIIVGIWGLITPTTDNKKSDETSDSSPIKQKMDSIKTVNERLKKKQQNLQTKIEQQKAALDSLKNMREKSTSNEQKKQTINEAKNYKVQPDDNLWKIAKKFYDDGYAFQKIVKANKLDSPGLLKVNQKLKIPK